MLRVKRLLIGTCTGSRNQWNIKARILKMYSRSAKGGEKGDPNRNPWLAKMYNVMLTKKLISFQDLKYPGLRRPDLLQIWQTFLHNAVSSAPRTGLELLIVVGTNCICSCKSNYHTIMTVPYREGFKCKNEIKSRLVLVFFFLPMFSLYFWSEAFSDAEIPNDFSATLFIELQTTIHQDKPLLLD